jgi:hypothetical protein
MRINKSLITNQITGAGTGSVTSVAMTVPTGFAISGTPITSSGTLALTFSSGYALPPSQTGNSGKYLTTDGTSMSWATVSGGGVSGTVNYLAKFDTTTSVADSIIYENGFVGIGTTTAGTGELIVSSATADNHLQLNGTAPSIRFTDTPTSATYNQVIGQVISANNFITNTVAGDLAIANASGGSILFGIGSTEAMRIFTSTRNVAIGGSSTDIGDKLYVSGNIKSTAQLKLTGYTSTSSYPGTAAGYLAFDSSGNILSAAAPSGGTPAGINTQIQYNNSGAFGASSAFTYVDSTGQLSLRKDQNASTLINLSNYTSGASSSIALLLWSSAGSIGQIGKYSATTTTYKTITANSTYVYHGGSGSGAGDLNLFADVNGIVFTAGGFSQPHMKLFSSGNFAVNSNTDNGYKFYVNGTTYLANYVFFGNFQYVGRSDMVLGTGNVTALALRSGSTINFAPNTTWMATMTDAGMSIGTSSNPNANSILELVSTTKGFLPPRMTNAQRTAIGSPTIGLIVYCTNATEGLYIYKSSGWTFII